MDKKLLDILLRQLSHYFDDVTIKYQDYKEEENANIPDSTICTVIFKKDGIGNNTLYYMAKQEQDSVNINGDVLVKAGQTVQKHFHFGNNTLRTNYDQLRKVSLMLSENISFTL